MVNNIQVVSASSNIANTIAKQITMYHNNLIITMPGDLPGMSEKNLVFSNGYIIYEDNDRIYIEY